MEIEITSPYKGRTYKTANVTGAVDENAALAAVMAHFGETTDRLADWRVSLVGETFVVTLFTD